jgi:DNA-binding beta-propeller fold protein YncE
MATREQTYSQQDTHELAITRALTRAYALDWEMIAYAAIFLLALITRFADLGARVMSHDESLHTYYSWRLFEYGEFAHTPLMHGPVLFHMTALSYFLFGVSDFTARIYPATLGVLMVLFPVLLRRWLGRSGALIASVMLLISPMVLFHNRYIREDTPSVFWTLCFIYAALQYIDGERPRRPVWLWVLSAGLLLSLASKEVAFIYIIIVVTFMVFYWLARVAQEVGIQRRPSDDLGWEPPPLQLLVGHLILLGLVSVTALAVGGLIRFVLSARLWIPTDAWIVAPLFLVMYLPLALWGVARNGTWNELWLWMSPDREERKRKRGEKSARKGGVASAIMDGLAGGRSAFMVLLAGAIIGALLALLIVCVLDVIKPANVWTQTVVRSQYDLEHGANATKEFATSISFDEAMFVRLLTWIGLPLLGVLFVLFLTAIFKFPGNVPIPWRELLLIVLIAFIATSALVLVERRSFVREKVSEQPFAADPTAVSHQDGEKYNNNWIIASWLIGTAATIAIAASRLLTNGWDFLNREPVFDVLIVILTLILPWAAAYPLYRAGYNLEDYNPNSVEGQDTLRAALWIIIPFFMVSVALGVSWNWKLWIPAAAIFLSIFAFFFTTVFSNKDGLVTGMIGSLGYWLEQQGVRRGSQPQYYYVLTQLPVYEFLPMIGALCAGVTGLAGLWGWRLKRIEAALAARESESEDAEGGAGFQTRPEAQDVGAGLALPGTPDVDESRVGAQDVGAELALPRAQPAAPLPESESWTAETRVAQRTEALFLMDDGSLSPDGELVEPVPPPYAALPARLARPFDWAEEFARRASDPEWIGAFPFLGMVGYWGIMILLALTLAGEKMPWLTTHLTVPLILLTGWWLGRVVTGIRWSALREGGWIVLLVALPLAFVAFAQVVAGFWGEGAPFRGRTVNDLLASGNWLSALLIFMGALYVVGHFSERIGWAQLARIAIVSGAVILAILTARVAYLAAYVNYDYATEFLVYAHSGPRVKTVLDEVNRIAQITNEGADMRIVFDDESSWPYTWYFRDYANYGFLRGEAGSVDPSSLDGARIVVVGNKKVGDVRRILGDRYYEFSYIRLWWPMQEYFNLNYDRVARIFGDDLAARFFRDGLFDIWWNRDYNTYAQAMCIDSKQYRCDQEEQWGSTPDERKQYRQACEQAVITECKGDDRFDVNKWPVSDRMYFFVDKQIAAQVWDAGIGSSTVSIREPEYPEDRVYQDRQPEIALENLAGLHGPRGIAVDANGLIYITDTDNSRIVVLNPDGTLSRTIGAPLGDPAAGGLKQPWGVDVAPDGTVYVADTWNNRVAVFSADGEYQREWGRMGVPADGFDEFTMWGPREIKIGPDGNLYVADTGGKRIRVYTPDGAWVRDIGSGGAGLGQLDEPVGLAFNPVNGDLVVAEPWNKRITVFDATGTAVRTFSVNMWFSNRQSYNRPYIAVSPDGTLIYVTDMDDRHRIVAYNLSGQPVFSFNQPDNLEAGVLGMRSPAGLAFDRGGRLYVVDSDQAKVFIFPPSEISGNIPPVLPEDAFPPDFSGDNENSAPQDMGGNAIDAPEDGQSDSDAPEQQLDGP